MKARADAGLFFLLQAHLCVLLLHRSSLILHPLSHPFRNGLTICRVEWSACLPPELAPSPFCRARRQKGRWLKLTGIQGFLRARVDRFGRRMVHVGRWFIKWGIINGMTFGVDIVHLAASGPV